MLPSNGHDSFLPRPSSFIAHSHTPVRRSMTCAIDITFLIQEPMNRILYIMTVTYRFMFKAAKKVTFYELHDEETY
jgi:hypothetical protein